MCDTVNQPEDLPNTVNVQERINDIEGNTNNHETPISQLCGQLDKAGNAQAWAVEVWNDDPAHPEPNCPSLDNTDIDKETAEDEPEDRPSPEPDLEKPPEPVYAPYVPATLVEDKRREASKRNMKKASDSRWSELKYQQRAIGDFLGYQCPESHADYATEVVYHSDISESEVSESEESEEEIIPKRRALKQYEALDYQDEVESLREQIKAYELLAKKPRQNTPQLRSFKSKLHR